MGLPKVSLPTLVTLAHTIGNCLFLKFWITHRCPHASRSVIVRSVFQSSRQLFDSRHCERHDSYQWPLPPSFHRLLEKKIGWLVSFCLQQLLIIQTFLNQMRIGKNIQHKDDRINSLYLALVCRVHWTRLRPYRCVQSHKLYGRREQILVLHQGRTNLLWRTRFLWGRGSLELRFKADNVVIVVITLDILVIFCCYHNNNWWNSCFNLTIFFNILVAGNIIYKKSDYVLTIGNTRSYCIIKFRPIIHLIFKAFRQYIMHHYN